LLRRGKEARLVVPSTPILRNPLREIFSALLSIYDELLSGQIYLA
jgi:hypothetical protein